MTVDEVKQKRAETLQALADHYHLSEEDKQAMLLEPEKVLPRLAAEIQLSTYENALRAVYAQMPGIIENVLVSQNVAHQRENEFFSEFPTLSNPEYRNKIQEAVRYVLHTKPNLSWADAKREIAGLSAYTLGVPLVPQPLPLAAPVPPQLRPHVPAGAGTAGFSPAAGSGDNPYGAISKEFESLD
jgi:hypothetical protein